MKINEPKIVEYKLSMEKSHEADEWWETLSEKGKAIALAIGRLVADLKKDKVVQIRENGETIQIAWAASKDGGVISAECKSFPKPESCDAEWFEQLPNDEKELALALTRVVKGDPERCRWN